MVSTLSLWLPVLVSAAFVFVASAIAWTASPHHRKDFAPANDEDRLMDAVRKSAGSPGMYYFPFPTERNRPTEEYKNRVREGPVGILRIRHPKAALNMGPALLQSFVLYFVVSLLAAHIAGGFLGADAGYMDVFGVVGVTSFMAYGLAGWQEAIWFGLPKWAAMKNTLDGTVYALLTAGTFGWLWPA